MTLSFRERGASGTQIDVVVGSLCIATLYKAKLLARASKDEPWRWTFFLTAAPPGFEHQGDAASLAEAKGRVAESWAVWIAAAGLEER
jgi:hypothetical protein